MGDDVRRLGIIVGAVVTVCVGVSAVWSVDWFLIQHGLLGQGSAPQPAPVATPETSAQHATSTVNTLTNIIFILIFVALICVVGYFLFKRRSARDAARGPGDLDDYSLLSPMRRRRLGDRTLDPIGSAPGPRAAPVQLAEPADPRELPADVARREAENLE